MTNISDTPFAIIALEPSLKYAVFQTCDLKSNKKLIHLHIHNINIAFVCNAFFKLLLNLVLVTWVGFSEDFINSQPDMTILEGYEKEIEESLYRNGIDVSTMVDIDLSFYELNNLVMATATSDPLVGGLTLNDLEKEFIKLMCKMLT